MHSFLILKWTLTLLSSYRDSAGLGANAEVEEDAEDTTSARKYVVIIVGLTASAI